MVTLRSSELLMRPSRDFSLIAKSRVSCGFTLVEILVVVAVAAVLAATLTLAIAGNAERRLESTSGQFRALLAHACDEAELGGREIGVMLGNDGYAFSRLDGNQWKPFAGNDELRARRWLSGLRVALERDGRPLDLGGAGARAPQLVCFSSRELTPFVLTLSLGDPPLRWRVRGDIDGRVDASRVEASR